MKQAREATGHLRQKKKKEMKLDPSQPGIDGVTGEKKRGSPHSLSLSGWMLRECVCERHVWESMLHFSN